MLTTLDSLINLVNLHARLSVNPAVPPDVPLPDAHVPPPSPIPMLPPMLIPLDSVDGGEVTDTDLAVLPIEEEEEDDEALIDMDEPDMDEPIDVAGGVFVGACVGGFVGGDVTVVALFPILAVFAVLDDMDIDLAA